MSGLKLQEAIYNELNGAIGVPVYDHHPQPGTPSGNHPSYPYVLIGDDTITDWDDDLKNGFEGTITIHTWSQRNGRKEAKEIQEVIYATLQRKTLTIGQFGTLGVSFEFEDVAQEADGRTYHGVQRFRVFYAEPYEFELGIC